MIPTDRYCHSGRGNGDNSILTKLSVMPLCRGAAEYYKLPSRGSVNLYGR